MYLYSHRVTLQGEKEDPATKQNVAFLALQLDSSAAQSCIMHGEHYTLINSCLMVLFQDFLQFSVCLQTLFQYL